MPQILYLHWHDAELQERIALLRKTGCEVIGHSSAETLAKSAEPLPDALIISLDRLPSHGRAVAEWFWEAKKRQHIPIIFAGGQADKVKSTKEKFPTAIFCATAEVPERLALLFKDK